MHYIALGCAAILTIIALLLPGNYCVYFSGASLLISFHFLGGAVWTTILVLALYNILFCYLLVLVSRCNLRIVIWIILVVLYFALNKISERFIDMSGVDFLQIFRHS
jgi:hypothetical protein